MQTACRDKDMAVSISANGVSLGSAKVDENGDPIYTSAGENTHLILEWGEGRNLIRPGNRSSLGSSGRRYSDALKGTSSYIIKNTIRT